MRRAFCSPCVPPDWTWRTSPPTGESFVNAQVLNACTTFLECGEYLVPSQNEQDHMLCEPAQVSVSP